MLSIMENRVFSADPYACRGNILTCICVSVETWKIAAADFQSYPVPFFKNIAGCPSFIVGLARIHKCGLLLGVPVAAAQNPLRQVLREAIRPHVDQLCSQV